MIHFNIILPNTPRFQKSSRSLGSFLSKIYRHLSSYARYMPRQSHTLRFYRPNKYLVMCSRYEVLQYLNSDPLKLCLFIPGRNALTCVSSGNSFRSYF